MDFFFRKRPCLLIEEQHTLENTKKLFLNKINFLQKQYKFCFESLQKNSNIAPEFIRGSLFSFDFGSKILDSLAYLTSSSEVEWKFLKSYISDTEFGYILGNFKKNYSILCIEEISENSDSFFFGLLRMRAIDLRTWRNLCILRSFSYSFGLSCPNDSSYYSSKGRSAVVPPESLKNLTEEFGGEEEEFFRFLGRPINFKHLSPIIWRLFRIVEEKKNEDDVILFLKKNQYKYDLIRQNKKDLKFSSEAFPVFSECLATLKNFSDLYFIAFEFELFDNLNLRELFKHILLFFFSQRDHLFESLGMDIEKMSEDERIFNAMEMLAFINSLAKNEISLAKGFDRQMEKNFRQFCELSLAILKDEGSLKRFCILNFFAFPILLELVKTLQGNKFFGKHYSKYVSDYLVILSKIN